MSTLVHEKTYKGVGIAQFIHRSRLKAILNMLASLDLENEGQWADFGCSNGFILSVIQDKIIHSPKWYFFGFDQKSELLELGRQKKLPNTEFHDSDLNRANQEFINSFDIVTCFETIEHVGNYKKAFENLYGSCKVNGLIIISVPNETGLPGIVKYFPRRLMRRKAYRRFFNDSREINYVVALFTGRNIDTFRNREAAEWKLHLGFDYRSFEKYLEEEYVIQNRCTIENRANALFDFNKLFVIRKNQ